MTATTQPGITLDDCIANQKELVSFFESNGGETHISAESHLVNCAILDSLIRLREITTSPDAWAVRNNQGYWVGIWNDRATAEDVAAKGQPSHGQVVVPVALLLRGKP